MTNSFQWFWNVAAYLTHYIVIPHQEEITWADIENDPIRPSKSDYDLGVIPGEKDEIDENDPLDMEEMEYLNEEMFLNEDIGEHIDELLGGADEGAFITIPQLNYSIPWQTKEDSEYNELAKFIPESRGELFPNEGQVCTFFFLNIIELESV